MAASHPWQLSILLVDDVGFTRDIVARMLKVLGHQIDTASSGQEALQHGCQRVFDLVLMDISMPGMDGLETIRRWRTPGNGLLDPDTPVFALTANTAPAGLRQALQAGMNGYLTKPASHLQLATIIERTIRQQLARGIDLTPNPVLQHPLLDISDPAIGTALRTTLLSGHARLMAAGYARARQRLLDGLHALKGCAGQAGMACLYRHIEWLETRIGPDGWPSRLAFRSLGRTLGHQIRSTDT